MAKKVKKASKKNYVILYKYDNYTEVTGPYTKISAINQIKSYDNPNAASIHELGKGQKVKVTVELV